MLPKNSTINAIYNQLQYLEDQEKAATAQNKDDTQQQYYQTKPDDYYQPMPAATTNTFYGSNNNGNNGNNNVSQPACIQYAATLPRASPVRTLPNGPSDDTAANKPTAGLMISHGKPNFVRPTVSTAARINNTSSPSVTDSSSNNSTSSDVNDLSRTLRRLRSADPLEESTGSQKQQHAAAAAPSTASSSASGSSRNSPTPNSGTRSPFIVRNNVPIVLQQQQQQQQAVLDTRNDEDISNVIRRLRSVESPDRGNLVAYNNVVPSRAPLEPNGAGNRFVQQPQQQQQQQPKPPQQLAGQWTFVPHSNGNGANGNAGFQHTIEYTPVAQQQPPQQLHSQYPSTGHSNIIVSSPTPTPHWTFSSPNGNDAGFHQTVEYPSELQRPAPPASPIETTLDSLKKTLASVTRSPVSGRKVNPNQPQPPQQQPHSPAQQQAGTTPAANPQDLQRQMQTLRKVDLKQNSSWMNRHNHQSPPNSPPAAAANVAPIFNKVPAAVLAAPAAGQTPGQTTTTTHTTIERRPVVIHHVIQQQDDAPVAAPVVPTLPDVRNIVSFARDLATAPNRYPDKVVVVNTQTRTEPDGRTVKETTTTTTTGNNGGLNGNNNGGIGSILPSDDMFFTNLKFVIDENGDIRPNAFAQLPTL